MLQHYVYQLIDPQDGLTFYVGKGTGKRAYQHEKTIRNGGSSSNIFKDAKIAQLLLDGWYVRVQIGKRYQTSKEACAAEQKLIASMPHLTNHMQADWGHRSSLNHRPCNTRLTRYQLALAQPKCVNLTTL